MTVVVFQISLWISVIVYEISESEGHPSIVTNPSSDYAVMWIFIIAKNAVRTNRSVFCGSAGPIKLPIWSYDQFCCLK